MELNCCLCGKPTTVRDAEYKRQAKKGRTWFCCSKECATKWAHLHRRTYLRKTTKEVNDRWMVDGELMSYILGFVYGDGTICLNKDGVTFKRVTLLSTDLDILQSIKDALRYSADIKVSSKETSTTKACYSLNFHSSLARDLQSMGMVKDKEAWLLGKLNIIDMKAFLRGLLDSDGSIRCDHRIALSFLGRPALMKGLAKLNELSDFNLYVDDRDEEVGVRNKVALVKLDLYGEEKVKMFLKWLYAGTTICMHRKKEIAERILKCSIDTL